MRGRKPKPTALKILEATRADRVNFNEPAPPPADLTPPEWLAKTARDHWNELAPLLATTGIMTQADRAALATLCDAFMRFRHDPDDYKARDLYRRMLVEFGLTPSSRSRLKSTKEKPKDALAEFLSKRKQS